MRKALTGIILAGGKSQRMGKDKALLPWGNATLIEHVIKTLQPLVDELIVAVDDATRFRFLHAQVVEDLLPCAHALGGIYTGLVRASHERCFVCACDMPFVNPRFVRFLAGESDNCDIVVPKTTQGFQMLHAIYTKSALETIEAQIHARRWGLQALVLRVRARIIEQDTIAIYDPDGASFVNLNSPDDYSRAFAKYQAMASMQKHASGINGLSRHRQAIPSQEAIG